MAYAYTRTIAPTVEPVTPARVRTDARIGTEWGDSDLNDEIAAARERAEHITQRSLLEQTWQLTMDRFPTSDEGPGIRLWWCPILSVESVQYVDVNGATQTLSSSAYAVDKVTEPGWLEPADGTSWPDTDDVINAVTITFKAGYGTEAADVPAAIRQWIRAQVVASIDNPSGQDMTGKGTSNPRVDRLLDAYVVYTRG